MENWKDIVGYEGLYQISDKGNVRRVVKDGYRTLKPYDKWLYLSVDLSKNREHKRQNIHRLVALHFIPNPRMCPEVNHKDGNKHNNCVENLEWVTKRENQNHSETVLKHYMFGKPPKRVKMIDIENDKVIQEFDSISEAGRYIQVSQDKVRNARIGITNCCIKKTITAYGYKWKYAD